MNSWLTDHYIEIFGAATGVLYVFLEIRQKVWLWPLGIVTSAVYIRVFYQTQFYADMGLQWYYLVISIYGWYWWKRGGSSHSSDGPEISRANRKSWLFLLLAIGLIFLIIWIVLARFTDSPIPGWDAFTTSVSVVATWMLARKMLEHWILWIVADIVSLGLYIYKGLFPTVVLFAVYTVMAFIGYRAWLKEYKGKGNMGPVLSAVD